MNNIDVYVSTALLSQVTELYFLEFVGRIKIVGNSMMDGVSYITLFMLSLWIGMIATSLLISILD